MANGMNYLNESRMVFSAVEKLIRQQENYVPRNYQTVGGMWTVDTYKKDGVTLQVMDEGYTTKIQAKGVMVTDKANEIEFQVGDLNRLKEVAHSLGVQFFKKSEDSKERRETIESDEPYLMLCNVEKADRSSRKRAKEMLMAFPQMKELPLGYIGSEREEDTDYHSLWIPESLFLSVWTFLNFRDLKNGFLTIEDGKKYMDIQQRKKYIKSFHEIH